MDLIVEKLEKIGVLPLDKMTDDESLEFILKQLEIPESEIPEFREESKEFIELIGGLPLALHQAVAYIKQEKKSNALLSRPYKMSDYAKEFKSSAEKLQNLPPAPDSSTTIFTTWDLTLKKIKKGPIGEMAIYLIEAMSCLHADKIPIDLLLQLLPHNTLWMLKLSRQQDPKSVREGLNLLEKYSMIKTTGDFASIHRQVQFVITEQLKSSGRLIKLFNHLVEKCSIILKSIQVSECNDLIHNVHQIVNHPFDFIPMDQKFLDFMAKFGTVLHEAGRYSESLELCKKIYSKRRELLGENHEKTLRAQHKIALNLHKLRRYDEALTLFKEILEMAEDHPDLGVDHPKTITIKYNMARVLEHQEKLQEALEMFRQVSAQRKKLLGENHPETLKTQNAIASVHSKLGALMTERKNLSFWFSMSEFEEASKTYNEVNEKEKESSGEIQLDTIVTLGWVGANLEQEGKFKEALDIYKKVYEMRKAVLGEAHPYTIRMKSKIEQIESKL